MALYKFSQNNSGGNFHVDSKLCHMVVIEADNENEAINIAEDLGCYWYGVECGLDCDCCGDRWSIYTENITEIVDRYKSKGLEVKTYDYQKNKSGGENEWRRKYKDYKIIKQPKKSKSVFAGGHTYTGEIAFDNEEQYLQFLADEYGWTYPDCRIFYKDGTVKEIFSKKVKKT